VTDALRVRLEGALEVLEAEQASFTRLRALATRTWELHASELLAELERFRASASTHEDAHQRAHRVPEARRVLDSIERGRRRLTARLDSLLRDTAVARVNGLEAKLAVWEELARNVGPAREGTPLSDGRGFMRSHEWWVAFGAIAAVVALEQSLLSFLLVALGVVWRDLSKRELTWRMFDDCVELQDGERTVRIPLASLESVSHDARDGLRLKALRDVRLHGDASLFQFALKLKQVQAEQQARAKYQDASAPALWLGATLQQDDIHVGGLVVVCEAGFVFVPERGLERAWGALVGATRLVRGDVLEALRSLPSKLVAERFQALRELPGVVHADGYGEAAWQPLGDILLVALEADRQLFIRCSTTVQERLRQLREARR
jgi:hypothetical protein